MSLKHYTPAQIMVFLREAEVSLSQGDKVGQICRDDVVVKVEMNTVFRGTVLPPEPRQSAED